ncbi:hypothetical protein Dacet_2629 [Denitrovibrio acetiphilus DSM 12809]|uniref:Uncharacterized protein n=1 Tax=Denitrovibrio acetiphilus (strain DSM 12809 / NBRC 114555 / N2460) TaxID=522772 RepID=D4H531_DENA2|nr:hypothetical protein [Denitrovibrio acetiphilus]ADD69387.1 hypothetical protein Dacet_2629 [Denitrovibrio acetiphilus DSM 12809]
MDQSIASTFVGSSDPVNIEYSLSYYGSKFPSAEKTTIGSTAILLDSNVKIAWTKTIAKVTTAITAGIALPSWSMSSLVEGQVKDDEMVVHLTEDNVLAGMLLGVMFDVDLIFEEKLWHPGHPSLHGWVSGHWGTEHSFNENIKFDLLGICVDLLYSLGKQVPGFKKILAIIPKGLLDNMQVYGNGIAVDDGIRLEPNMPMKWDLFYIIRQLAELGADVVSGPLVEVVVPLTTVAEALVDLEEEVGVCLGFGPQVSIVFPIRIEITDLVADDVVFQDLEFGGSGKITGTNPKGDPAADSSVERIGVHCKHTLEMMNISVGIWASISVLKVLSKSGTKNFNLIDLLEDELGFELALDSFNSSVTNDVGAAGADEFGDPADTIEINFI